MSNFSTLSPITEGLPGTAPTLWAASTPDTYASVIAAGYLNDQASKFKANDLMWLNFLDGPSVYPLNPGLSASLQQFQVIVSGGNTSLLPYTHFDYALVNITAAQWNGMYAAPINLIAAPGANKLLVIESMQLIETYGTAAFAAGGVVAAQYDSTVHGAGVAASNTEAAADFFVTASTTYLFKGATGAAPFSTTVNKGIYLSNATGAFTTGDSTFMAKLAYRTVAVV